MRNRTVASGGILALILFSVVCLVQYQSISYVTDGISAPLFVPDNNLTATGSSIVQNGHEEFRSVHETSHEAIPKEQRLDMDQITANLSSISAEDSLEVIASDSKTRNPNQTTEWLPSNVSLEQSPAQYQRMWTGLNNTSAFPQLLTAPFYVYEEFIWTDNLTLASRQTTLEQALQEMGNPKHTDDYWFFRSALEHPMRTRDPTQAKLFLVTPPLNYLVQHIRYGHRKFCWNKMCNRQLLSYINNILGASPYFQESQGTDHILVNSYWGFGRFTVTVGPLVSNIIKCHAIAFEGHVPSPGRLNFPSLYVGSPCPLSDTKTHDWAMICSFKDNPRLHVRQRICQWLQTAPENRTNYTVSHCGPGPQCPALAVARFGFHPRGDTLSSNRLMDTILSGTVPIFTLPGQSQAVPSWIDWNRLSYYAKMDRKRSFHESLQSILNDTKGYRERHDTILEHRILFDWRTGATFDMYMYMFQRHLLPETTVDDDATIPYSILKLDHDTYNKSLAA